jgi:hypothetical protein
MDLVYLELFFTNIFEEISMHSIIPGQFWMKGGGQYPTLSNGYWMRHPRDLYRRENLYC